jgi:type IV pilus assembly protein PilW
VSQNPTRNKAGGVTDAGNVVVARLQFANGARLVNLGGKVVVKVYAIRGGNLTVCEWIAQNCTVAANYEVVANDIVSMRAVYGQDFDGSLTPVTINGDGIVDQWSRTARTTANQVSRTMAVGVQITARSGLKEKPTSGTVCDATTNQARPDKAMTLDWYDQYKPVVGTLAGAVIDLSTTSADWSCYRYKLFQTTVPIRNVIWRP